MDLNVDYRHPAMFEPEIPQTPYIIAGQNYGLFGPFRRPYTTPIPGHLPPVVCFSLNDLLIFFWENLLQL